MKTISIVTPCFNEEDNVRALYFKVKMEMQKFPNLIYDHIFIDNLSTDRTRVILQELATEYKNIKLIFNSRNFGPIRSPYYGLLQSNSDATVLMVADLQDPPELLPEFIKYWGEGYKVVIGAKNTTEEVGFMRLARKSYYSLINKIADIELIKNYTGFGLYDRNVLDQLRVFDVSYPYLRGLISEIGYPIKLVPYYQPLRKNGKSKYSFYNLYQVAMLGVTSHSLVPLRIATFAGFFIAIVSLLISAAYLLLKIIYWNNFPLGIATVLIAIFFLASVQIFFIGILGEYIGAILIETRKRPLVVEEKRINF